MNYRWQEKLKSMSQIVFMQTGETYNNTFPMYWKYESSVKYFHNQEVTKKNHMQLIFGKHYKKTSTNVLNKLLFFLTYFSIIFGTFVIQLSRGALLTRLRSYPWNLNRVMPAQGDNRFQ